MRAPNEDFTRKVVVITGGASGIGLALGRAFALRGARIALLDLDSECARERARELEQEGHDCMALGCDVTSADDCRAAISVVIERFGGVDILVNNAGITAREAFADTTLQTFERVMAVNFFGALSCTKAALGSLIERRGMIIVTSSIAGLVPLLGRSAYCASKHALHGLFGTLRAELREKGVHVLIVCPSFVKTNLQSRALGGDGEVTEHPQSTVGNVDTPESLAEEICAAAECRQPLMVHSAVGKLSHLLNFLVPQIYERIMTAKTRHELERT